MSIFNEREKLSNLIESMSNELNEATIRFSNPEINAIVNMVDGGWDGTQEPHEVKAIESAIRKMKESKNKGGIVLLTQDEMRELCYMIDGLWNGDDDEEYASSAIDKIKSNIL